MRRRTGSKPSSICMLSTHGYFDPVPQLGKTDTGGQVVYVLQLARALAAHGLRVDIYTRWFDASRQQVDPLPGCPGARVIRIPCGPWEFIPKEEIYSVLPELAENMIAFIRQNRLAYDLFHGHYVDAGIVALEVAQALDRPAFFTAHSLGAWKRDQMGGDPAQMEKRFRFSHRVAEELRIFRSVNGQTATTELQREKMEQLYGFTSHNITVIPPGVDIRRFRPLGPGEKKTEIGLPGQYILCLSRIDSNKGHDLLLNAFDIVRQSIPWIHLAIGGGSPKAQQREREVLNAAKTIIEQKHLQDRVHILGYVPDEMLAACYQQAEIFVLPSIFEPFGMTALEAMACGTPVVASRFGGISEYISSGENGLLVDPCDAGEFAGALTMLLQDRGLAESMGKAGRHMVRSQFSWEAIAERHITFYRSFTNAQA